MATIKVPYAVQSCVCGKELLRIPSGSQEIASPLVTCPKCGKIYRTDMRVEWYAYPRKWSVFIVLPLIVVVMFLVGAVMYDAVIGIMAALFGLIIGLFITMKDVFRIIKSKNRMRSAGYLDQLNQAGLITPADYAAFRAKADKP